MIKKFSVFLILFIHHLFLLAQAGGGKINPIDISAEKKITGLFSDMTYYTQQYNGRSLRITMIPGKYYLFPPEGYQFGENIHLLSFQEGLDMIEKANYIEFQIDESNKTYNDEYTIQIEINEKTDRYDLLFLLLRKYSPYLAQKLPTTLNYKTTEGKTISSTNPNYDYTVVYFIGRLDMIPVQSISSLNQLQENYSNVQFVALSPYSKAETANFKRKQQFTWHMSPSLSSRELTKFTINSLISEPSIYIVNNVTNEIVFYYYDTYALAKALEMGLKELQQ